MSANVQKIDFFGPHVDDVPSEKENVEESIDLDDDYVKYLFYEQSKNKQQRTSPNDEASQPPVIPEISCKFCNSRFKTSGLLKRHMKEQQSDKQEKDNVVFSKCRKCDFNAKSDTQMKKHLLVRHSKRSEICWFWSCQKQNCEFEHPKPQVSQQNHKFKYSKNIPCKFQNKCLNQNCGFLHFEQPKPCFFQNNCQNAQCKFEHFEDYFLGHRAQNMAPDPQPGVWRPW